MGGLTWKGWAGEGPILSTRLAKAEQADAEEGVGSEVDDLCWPWRLLLSCETDFPDETGTSALTRLTRPATPQPEKGDEESEWVDTTQIRPQLN